MHWSLLLLVFVIHICSTLHHILSCLQRYLPWSRIQQHQIYLRELHNTKVSAHSNLPSHNQPHTLLVFSRFPSDLLVMRRILESSRKCRDDLDHNLPLLERQRGWVSLLCRRKKGQSTEGCPLLSHPLPKISSIPPFSCIESRPWSELRRKCHYVYSSHHSPKRD